MVRGSHHRDNILLLDGLQGIMGVADGGGRRKSRASIHAESRAQNYRHRAQRASVVGVQHAGEPVHVSRNSSYVVPATDHSDHSYKEGALEREFGAMNIAHHQQQQERAESKNDADYSDLEAAYGERFHFNG